MPEPCLLDTMNHSLKKNKGMTTKLFMVPKPSKDVILAAIIIPREVMDKAIINIPKIVRIICVMDKCRPTSGKNARTIIPCKVAIILPLNVLPNTIDVLDIGATIISFRNPNSRSQIIVVPVIIDANSMFITINPGKIYCVYVKPSGALKEPLKPVPRIKSHIIGRTIEP